MKERGSYQGESLLSYAFHNTCASVLYRIDCGVYNYSYGSFVSML